MLVVLLLLLSVRTVSASPHGNVSCENAWSRPSTVVNNTCTVNLSNTSGVLVVWCHEVTRSGNQPMVKLTAASTNITPDYSEYAASRISFSRPLYFSIIARMLTIVRVASVF